MSHAIDMSNGRANMAYVGERPWHGYGQILTPDASIEVWTKEAGLGFTVLRTPVQFTLPGDSTLHNYKDRWVQYRHDTNAPLGIVTSVHKNVQPADVMEFMRRVCEKAGAVMETAGSLYGGTKVWAMARLGANVKVVGNDEVAPYLFIITSFDGSLATTISFTTVRIVCQNTANMALRATDRSACTLKIPHAVTFDPEHARAWLGLGVTHFENWMARAQWSAQQTIAAEQADEVLVSILRKNAEHAEEDIRESKAYNQIMSLFYDGNVGSDQAGCKRTKWGLYNAVTYYADHVAGNKQEARLRSTWTGALDTLKSKAQELLFNEVAPA